jgi:hypothetical protein
MSEQKTSKSKTLPWKPTPIVGEIEGTPYKLYNWNGYGIVVGPGRNTSILDDIQNRRKNVKQNMMIVVGSPGEGKSYFALRLAEIFDRKFVAEEQIVFERGHLLRLIGPNSPLRMGQVILIDEAQFIAGARRWYEDIQKDVMEHIEAIRSKGFIIIIVALHINLLDKIIRQYVLSHMVIMKKRGLGTFYKLWTPPFGDKLFRKRLNVVSLQIPDFERCEYPNCLICKYLERCMTHRAIYERTKRDFLNMMNAQSTKKAEQKERRKIDINYGDLIKQITEHSEELIYNKTGKLNPESVNLMLEKRGLQLTDIQIKKIIRRGQITNPEIFNKKKEEVNANE